MLISCVVTKERHPAFSFVCGGSLAIVVGRRKHKVMNDIIPRDVGFDAGKPAFYESRRATLQEHPACAFAPN